MNNIFISRPSIISTKYEKSFKLFAEYLISKGLILRRLGSSDYSRKAPLVAVMEIMEECHGAIILGFPQIKISSQIKKVDKIQNQSIIIIPTPWNQIEAVLAFKQKIPVLVVAQVGICDGIFDYGVTGEFVLKTDLVNTNWYQEKEFQGVFNEWLKDIGINN